MIAKIKKRDGRIVDFDANKIIEAIFKAAQAVGGHDRTIAENLSKQVVTTAEKRFKDTILSVEDVQDIVEKVLIENGHAKTAKAYILYREQHAKLRETKKIVMDIQDTMDGYLKKSDWRVNENSNVDYSFSGLFLHIAGSMVAKYTLDQVYAGRIGKAHINGDFHLHDLSFGITGYCSGWSIRQLLAEGFNGVPGKIEASPPKHLSTATIQLVNFLGSLQNEWAGAQAFSSFDTYLAPFVRKDSLSYKEVKQQIQQLVYNLNIASRWGGQTIFSNFTLDWMVPEDLKDEPVILGGKQQKETYADFQNEMDLINKAFIETLIEGDMHGRVFTFPIPTYNITKDFDWNSENANLLFEMTAKYGLPYFQNFINSDLKPSDVRSMCLDAKEEIMIMNSKKIRRLSIKEVAETYKSEDFDEEGWTDCKKEGNLKVLSLNPKTLRLEWSPVKRFLRVMDKKSIEIMTEDGKKAEYSLKHPIAVYTPNGVKMKFAKDVQKGDYLLTLKKADDNIFSKTYQKIDDLVLNKDLAKILGYFTADGNYLFESRKGFKHYGEPRGLQFSFKTGDLKNLSLIKSLVKKVFRIDGKEKQDPRYNTYYLYIYNTEIARKLYNAGFKKYGRLPQVLFNSPKSVIESFLNFHFRGDGYEKRKEIHLNDLELSRDLALLHSLTGQPITYRLRKKGQVIHLQHANSITKSRTGWLNNPILAHRVPVWMAVSTKNIPDLKKSRMVGFAALEKYNAFTPESLKIKNSSIYLTKVKATKTQEYGELKEFYDIELEKNHLFLHSLGQISFNCCRLQLNLKELSHKTGGLFGFGESTGSVGVVTINMPRIGYLSKSEEEFFERLGHLMDLAKDSLELKRRIVTNNIQQNLLPYTKRYLGNLDHHFSTIGLNGMNEACLNFLGQNIATKEGRELALKTLEFMRERITEYQEQTGHIYNLEGTPAEGTSYRLARIDKRIYPNIITAGEKEPYYTNSTHLPVDYTSDIFEAFEMQDELQTKYTGGTVLHAFVGERITNAQNCKLLVKKIASNFRLPYFTITPTFSICQNHGYLAGEQNTCPKCGAVCDVYSRVVGYYRPVRNWNPGKREEFKQRLTYNEPKNIAKLKLAVS